jgi:recombination protein RecR
MSSAYTATLNELIEEFGKLPGIGPKTAERLAFHILKADAAEALALADAIRNVKTKIQRCQVCFNLSESDTCHICADAKRDRTLICVVEQPKDVVCLEKTGACRWLYHVLGGHIAPLDGIDASDLTIDKLVERVRVGEVKEIIMATNPNLEGDGTSLYISSLLRPLGVKITRLARGLPTGSTIEYASGRILSDAILGRQEIDY